MSRETDTDWAERVGLGRITNETGPIPPPPYQVQATEFVMIGVGYDAASIAGLLPDGLEPAEGWTGGFYIYYAPTGWGIAPYRAALAWIDVKGYDAPDGSPARFLPAMLYSGNAYRFFRAGNARCREAIGGGEEQEADRVIATVRSVDNESLQLSIRPGDEAGPVSSGIHYYLAVAPEGHVNILSAAFLTHARRAEPIAVEIESAAGSMLDRLRPRTLRWAARPRFKNITISGFEPLSRFGRVRSEGLRTALLNVLAVLDRGAMLINEIGRVAYINDAAAGLLGDGMSVAEGVLRCRHPADERALRAVLEQAAASPSAQLFEAVPIRRTEHDRPLLAQAMSLSAEDGQSAVVLFLVDPDSRRIRDTGPALQLLGLTPAESRIAGAVGSGLSPREAAASVGNSESTVRSSLITIYSKLGIGRQSELARLVARLEVLGT